MSYPVMPLGFLGSQGDQDTYRIEQSLRFNSADSAYLNRTFSGTPYTYTLSWWVKRGTLSVDQIIFGSRQGASNPSYVEFLANNTITITLGVSSTVLTTSMVFRDPSAWYHFVLSVTPSATSYFYVNGTQVGSWTSSATPYLFNSAYTNAIGRYGDSASFYFDGYMAEINFIDGQALSPSSFGETDAITGRWKAKTYSGTYGTNGFYLKFADNSGTTATTLGKDSSGNGNNWTPNNFSVTAGAGNDSLVDSPTNYGTDTGVGGEVRGNYCTLNPLQPISSVTYSNGNIDVSGSANYRTPVGTIPIISGKWRWEVRVNAVGPDFYVGIGDASLGYINTYSWAVSGTWSYGQNGTKYVGPSSGVSYGASYTTGDVIGVEFDADAKILTFFKNGVSQGVAFNSGITNGPWFPLITVGNGSSASVNFGQRVFAYSGTSGFKALCTTNLPQPTIQRPSSAMDVVTYTGNGSARSITGLGFSPDLVWIKGRSGATDHAIYDSVRGAQLDMASNLSSAETTQSQGLTAFNSDGFSIGTLAKINTNTSTYVGWAWDASETSSTNTDGSITSTVRVNTQAGVSIVRWTDDTSTNNRVGHGLGVTPAVVLYKRRNSTGSDWYWTTTKIDGSFDSLVLNSTAAKTDIVSPYTAPTSTTFSNYGTWSGGNLIAYCFAEVEGFSKFGSYVGNNSTDGPFIWCGFRPKYVLAKKSSATGPWMVFDSVRDTFNVSTTELRPNETTAEPITTRGSLDILSNGFKIRSTSVTFLGELGDFIFAAFAESPFKYARAR